MRTRETEKGPVVTPPEPCLVPVLCRTYSAVRFLLEALVRVMCSFLFHMPPAVAGKGPG